MAKLYSDSQESAEFQLQEANDTGIDFDGIFAKFENLSAETRQQLIVEESALKTSKTTVDAISDILMELPEFKDQGIQVDKNISDTLLTLLEISLTSSDPEAAPVGIQILNKHCYTPSLIEHEPQVRRSIELKQQILEDLFGWQLLAIDEDLFNDQQDKKQFLKTLMGVEENEHKTEIKEQRSGGRRVKKR